MELDAEVRRPPGSRRIPAQVYEAAVEVARLREAARAQAAALVARAEQQARSIRARAAVEGREEGLALAAGAAARAVLLADRLAARAEPELVELAFAVAARVLGRAAERDREVAVEMAARALEAARLRCDVTLRVHPDDLAAVREQEGSLGATLRAARRFRIVPDEGVGRGGAVVETEAGTVDGRLDRQLAALRAALDEGPP